MKSLIWASLVIFPCAVVAQMFPAVFQQAGTFAAPGSLPAVGEVWQSQWISGKPYSATVVTHTAQTFGNGTNVDHTETALVFRDFQGRTRRETIGTAQSGAGMILVSIVDPVAAAQYDFMVPENPSHGRGEGVARPAEGGGTGPGRVLRYNVQPLSANILANETKPGGLSPYQQAIQRANGKKAGRGPDGAPRPGPAIADLGTQMVSGVTAQGVRITTTIPAGSIGNDHDIPVVTDRWVSPELQVLVKSVYSDPRFGTTTYELTNISRTPPDPALFQLPSGAEPRAPKNAGRGGAGGYGNVELRVNQAGVPPAIKK